MTAIQGKVGQVLPDNNSNKLIKLFSGKIPKWVNKTCRFYALLPA